MNPVFKATMMLGGSSALSLLIGLITTKYWAVMLGTDGMGYLSLMQNFMILLGLVGGMGIGTGLVRSVAQAVAENAPRRVAALHAAAWRLYWVLGALTVLVMLIAQAPVTRWLVNAAEPSSTALWICVAMLFNVAFLNLTGLINAYQRVETLAKINLLNRVAAAAASVLLIGWYGEKGVLPSLVLGALLGWLIAWKSYTASVPRPAEKAGRHEIRAALSELLRFGGPYTASMLVGGGIQLLIPALVKTLMSQDSAGIYRSANMISTVYLGLILTAMAQDYYPRLSAASRDASALCRLVNEQHQLILLLAIPMIALLLALGPFVIPLLFTRKFGAVYDILPWQFVGDLFKFSAWTMAFVFLARNQSRRYFLVEAVAGAATLVTTWLGARWFGLAGLGLAYGVSYLIYFLVVWRLVVRDTGLRWTRDNKILLLGGILCVALINAAALAPSEFIRVPVALFVALTASALCVLALERKYGLLTHVKRKLGLPTSS